MLPAVRQLEASDTMTGLLPLKRTVQQGTSVFRRAESFDVFENPDFQGTVVERSFSRIVEC